ncbi:threonine--tRNA ligase [Lawsonia intracellularis]|uniref:Threonine--tRNA ligase n=1 Tax=Lawsonia intracellularis (strain PHE/MN1-00) TaxID=363253 RepID=SYT_LAWIP|nr:threonine--tRNA ligase [Lawsonia intracellularis]Q1MRV8.1 RecName: Full=Threonine--tRNA ligase; AltName: Full=Threonyl-tRNA synthetase; Short=ThrRS [Lawsonia intracellularis PHE/MN1-00]AGC49617.1 threonyl-tRNA synthetase [Lawsonia intracellularis N343]KAA0205124.1 threonine--tRNA ligase [Lawsonia intracellularis]MBZ3892349.1 threonine--tRNA ligase [Lawsonia intracellularis]RBN32329.1 threonine--tRNA ligase [Lawsonia intracellularis]RBN33896.1 threonine--tRNA ligase [Lawsonia intracellulari
MQSDINKNHLTMTEGLTYINESGLKEEESKNIVGYNINGSIIDLFTPLPTITKEVIPITIDSEDGLEMLRHSAAHILAAAVKNLFPTVKISIGPSIENGFYYDFDAERPFTPEDFPAIEAEMQRIINESIPFERIEISKAEALEFFSSLHENYKVEIINSLEDGNITLYRIGNFTDLCKGPHVPNTNFIKAFKLLSVAGAYWRGNENNQMLSRIYATAFPNKKLLKTYLTQLEEAKRRDHRKLGKELNLFEFHEDIAPGMVFWQPNGMLLRTILEDFLRKEHLKRGYQLVQGPQLLRRELWEKSGHYTNYKENMYFTEIEEDVYGIKPMNCVSHMLLYKTHLHSYRELPQRYFELGVVHRHEKSGVLHGLLRVRQFTQDDAHIICMPEQLEEEIIQVITFVRDLMSLFDFNYHIVISTRPEKSIGSDYAWELATSALIQAVEKINLPYSINHGDGAFYGPKIDIKVTDAIGREWQLSTIQCDFTLPERFELEYVGQDGKRHQPVMIHRAIFGSIERFIGILTEHYAGAFPTWLTPIQVKILTVTDAQTPFAKHVYSQLQDVGIRVGLDIRNEKLGFKIREAQLAKIPYILVIGQKELELESVNVRLRTGENIGMQSVTEFIKLVENDCIQPFKRGGMNYRFS